MLRFLWRFIESPWGSRLFIVAMGVMLGYAARAVIGPPPESPTANRGFRLPPPAMPMDDNPVRFRNGPEPDAWWLDIPIERKSNPPEQGK